MENPDISYPVLQNTRVKMILCFGYFMHGYESLGTLESYSYYDLHAEFEVNVTKVKCTCDLSKMCFIQYLKKEASSTAQIHHKIQDEIQNNCNN